MLQLRHALRVDEEIVVGRLPHRRAVAVGVLVDDVVAHADMHRAGHAEVVPHAQHALFAVGELLLPDVAADGLAPAESVPDALLDDVVEPSRLGPQAELAHADVFGYAPRRSCR